MKPYQILLIMTLVTFLWFVARFFFFLEFIPSWMFVITSVTLILLEWLAVFFYINRKKRFFK